MAVRRFSRYGRNKFQNVKPRFMRQEEYHVLDPNVTGKLGPHPMIIEGEGDNQKRTVKLTPQEAKYWLDQGVIGKQPLNKLTKGEKQHVALQTLGLAEPVKAEAKKSERGHAVSRLADRSGAEGKAGS